MDPPLCGSTAISHNEFKSRELMEPQEASPMQQEMSVLGIDMAKRVFHAVGMDNTGKIVLRKRLSRHDLKPKAGQRPRLTRLSAESKNGFGIDREKKHGRTAQSLTTRRLSSR